MDTEQELKREIVDICRRMYRKEYVTALDGNVSVRIAPNRIICTPSGICKGMITEDDLIIADLDGNNLEGDRKPSSEHRMHATAYHLRDDIKAVIHAHPPVAIALSIAGVTLTDPVLPEIVFTVGSIPTVPYATPTTEKVAAAVNEYIADHDALILEKHGALTVAETVTDAFYKLEKVEHCARVIYYARTLGNVAQLNGPQVEDLLGICDKFGTKRPKIIRQD